MQILHDWGLCEFDLLYLILDLAVEFVSLRSSRGESSVCEANYGIGRSTRARAGPMAANLLDLVTFDAHQSRPK